MHWPKMKMFLARACLFSVIGEIEVAAQGLAVGDDEVVFRGMVGMSSNIASHSCGLMPREEIM